MKIIDVAIKDMTQATRSFMIMVFMFGVPILTTGLFYFLFGGTGGEEEEMALPRTAVQIVNLDEGSELLAEGVSGMPTEGFPGNIDLANVDSMGDVLVALMQSEAFSELLAVTVVADEATARAAVDAQEAAVAVVIPHDFTSAFMYPGRQAVILMYQDPTLTIGPCIVRSMLSQFIDNVSGTSIGIAVVIEQLSRAGVVIGGELSQAIAMQFIEASMTSQESSRGLIARSPAGENTVVTGIPRIVTLVMGGMSIFYAFFTGAASAQSILTEEENGTLSRLFTTPTPVAQILGGKFLSVAVTVMVQMSVLFFFGRLVFNIHWGVLAAVLLVIVGTVALASTFGLFIVSWMKNSRQAGIVFGGVLTLTGMPAMVSAFIPDAPKASFINSAALIFPQGWAVQSLRFAIEGEPISKILWLTGGILLGSVVFFAVGNWRMKKRFA